MRTPNRMITLFVLATVAVDMIAYRAGMARWRLWPNELVLATLIFSQTGLLWIWACLGTIRASVRLSAAAIGAMSWIGVIAPGDYELCASLFAMAAGIVLVLGFVRSRGWQLLLANETKIANPRRPLQFSLRSVMEAVTSFAIMLTLAKIILSPGLDYYQFNDLIRATPWFIILGIS
ncbi:MAG TPA: hypothetical protein VG056_14565, partial [Pirellulales bacterium]|nr:hypothetical protein [Pirellulales bacterium]